MCNLTDIQQAFVRRYMDDDGSVIGVRVSQIDGQHVLVVDVSDDQGVELPSAFRELPVYVREGRRAVLAYR